MSPRTDFLVRLAIAMLAAILLSPVVGLLGPDTPFHRIMTRTFQVVLLIVLVWPNPPRTWKRNVVALGLRPPHRFKRYASGFLLAAALLLVLLAASGLMGGRTMRETPYPKSLPSHLLKACFTATIVPIVEEVLFRGYMLRRIGGVASALLYALVHFFRPVAGSAPMGEFDPLLGFKRFPELLQSYGEPRLVTLGVFSLFLIGLALNRVTRRTGTLWAAVGIHAGLIFSVEIYRHWVQEITRGDPWIFGGSRLHDGVLGCLMAAALLALVSRLPLPRFARRASP